MIPGLVALVCGLGGAQAWAAPLDCPGALPDCLLAEAEVAAGMVARPGLRDEVNFSVALALAQLDRLDEALAAARNIANSRILAAALGEISQAAARAGDFALAYEIALDIVDARIGSARVAALQALAVAQAAAGEIEAAFDTVFAIDNPYRRSEAQAAIAVSVARSGDIPGAIRAASRIATTYWFTSDQHRLKVASGLVSRSGEFDHFWFYEALATIAQIQAANGDILGALQSATSIPDVAGRSRAAARIASVQADTGDIAGAYATAARIEAPFGDLEALVAIARAKARSGDFTAALDLAQEIALAYGDTSALVAVAVQQARQGEVDSSLKIAAALDNLESRTRALAGIADALAGAARLDEALRVVAMIPDAGERADAVQRISVALATAGDPARALAVAADHAGRRDHGEVVVAIALARAAAGDIDGAIATASSIDDAMLRGVALAGIAPLVR